jgi:hypothetical protein
VLLYFNIVKHSFGSVHVVVEALRMALNKMHKHVGQCNCMVKSMYVDVIETLLDCLLNYFNVYESV